MHRSIVILIALFAVLPLQLYSATTMDISSTFANRADATKLSDEDITYLKSFSSYIRDQKFRKGSHHGGFAETYDRLVLKAESHKAITFHETEESMSVGELFFLHYIIHEIVYNDVGLNKMRGKYAGGLSPKISYNAYIFTDKSKSGVDFGVKTFEVVDNGYFRERTGQLITDALSYYYAGAALTVDQVKDDFHKKFSHMAGAIRHIWFADKPDSFELTYISDLKNTYGITPPTYEVVDGKINVTPGKSIVRSHINPNNRLVLKNIGSNKIGVTKLVKEITGLGLDESKKIVENVPSVIKTGMTPDELQELADKFIKLGATVVRQRDGHLSDVDVYKPTEKKYKVSIIESVQGDLDEEALKTILSKYNVQDVDNVIDNLAQNLPFDIATDVSEADSEILMTDLVKAKVGSKRENVDPEKAQRDFWILRVPDAPTVNTTVPGTPTPAGDPPATSPAGDPPATTPAGDPPATTPAGDPPKLNIAADAYETKFESEEATVKLKEALAGKKVMEGSEEDGVVLNAVRGYMDIYALNAKLPGGLAPIITYLRGTDPSNQAPEEIQRIYKDVSFSWVTAGIPLTSDYPDIEAATQRCIKKIGETPLRVKNKTTGKVEIAKDQDGNDIMLSVLFDKPANKHSIYATLRRDVEKANTNNSLEKVYCGAIFGKIRED